MEEIAVGMVVEAVVTRLEPYGAWIEIEGRVGLVVIPEIAWSRIRHPGDLLSVGQRVTVKVLFLGPNGELSASIRAVHPERDPWYDPGNFAVGNAFLAPVVRVLGYGCFVELRPEVWALLRRERWSREWEVGCEVRARVISVDSAARKVEVEETSCRDQTEQGVTGYER